MFNSSLFNGESLYDLFRGIQRDIRRDVDAMPPAKLHEDIDRLVAEFEQRHKIEIPTLLGDEAYADEPPNEPNSDHFRIVLNIPFSGDSRGFKLSASSHPIVMDPCTVHEGRLSFPLTVHKQRPEDVVEKQKSLCIQISGGLATLRNEFDRNLQQVPTWVKECVLLRREKVAMDEKARGALAGVLRIKKREEASQVFTPARRQPLPIAAPVTAASPPNPVLEMAAYEDILNTIQAMVHVFERSPATFRSMDEEDLRMILLVALNGLYEGQATGETFNGEGKTDILIRRGDQNVFIAECLVWKGQAVLTSKMDDQLFKYATWRDSKLAILIFNRNKGFSDVITKMKETLRVHPQCIRELPFKHPSGVRFLFRRADDPMKEFTLTCLAFDVP
eukprot:TRINITY_DN37_c3_g1_i8.p1 TRINITY_DN37_c3_g1~~TRINITY_DN37_c3_g1_i8.p1  ORF type:complete len:390 (-),score=44.96 TRINITY_DN37_c3_g1_i8:153-1322(-)